MDNISPSKTIQLAYEALTYRNFFAAKKILEPHLKKGGNMDPQLLETALRIELLNQSRQFDINYYLGEENIFNLIWRQIEILNAIKKQRNEINVAFFVPQIGFIKNFGELPRTFEKLGITAHWVYGDYQEYVKSNEKNKWIAISNIISEFNGFDAIVTASVMDCLPSQPMRILHDHLSFAHVEMDSNLKRLRADTKESKQLESLNQVFEEYGAFIPFLPFYDLILTSSKSVHELSESALEYNGYMRSELDGKFYREKISPSPWEQCVDESDYRQGINIKCCGYLKLESLSEFEESSPEKVIVYAPSPEGFDENKVGPVWSKAVTSRKFGNRILRELAIKFPDYKIIYKPFADELPEVIDSVMFDLEKFGNVFLSEVGGNYWKLYSSANIFISDFSSTAYTYLTALKKPVIFFSPYESQLPESIRAGTYCANREKVGWIATDVSSVLDGCKDQIEKFDEYQEKVNRFCIENEIQSQGSAEAAARVILTSILERNIVNA